MLRAPSFLTFSSIYPLFSLLGSLAYKSCLILYHVVFFCSNVNVNKAKVYIIWHTPPARYPTRSAGESDPAGRGAIISAAVAEEPFYTTAI